MLTATLSHLAAVPIRLGAMPTNVDPDISPNWSALPFMSWFKDMAGGVQALMLVVMVIGILGAIAGVVLSKIASSRSGSNTSATVLLWCGVGAIVVGGASSIIAWAASQDVGF